MNSDDIKERIFELVSDAPDDFGLAVVLRAIQTTDNQAFLNAYLTAEGLLLESRLERRHWNLEHDNYDQQSEECKQFIGSLLGLTNHTTMKHHNCNCDILDKPSYHASDDPHSVGKKWVCQVHGKQEKTWLIHTEKQEYCKPCQEAPENVFDHTTPIKPTITANTVEAPTDESWTTEFYDKFGLSSSWWNSKYKSQTAKAVEEFIRELLQKERERGIAEGRADEAIFCHEHKGGGYEAGKSEAFSLVRKAVQQLPLRVPEADMVEDALSTLEGK